MKIFRIIRITVRGKLKLAKNISMRCMGERLYKRLKLDLLNRKDPRINPSEFNDIVGRCQIDFLKSLEGIKK